ncbi:hypothetical protein [Actinoplanes sp. NPDC051851]|uniref:hypothetical protein n=1 Tax=Actinoplanes sp. NPDC051851 TaxID=3154753 RepID=UPI0034252DFE
MNEKQDRTTSTPRRGRARKRAIRAQAARTGVAYSVAARQLDAVALRSGEMPATYGRTIYPAGNDPHRCRLVEARNGRSFAERLEDTRRAAVLPEGRARHLVERFPPSRGRAGSKVGPLYHGEGRAELLSMLYLAVAVDSPGLFPDRGDLAWSAELGEETALDTACAELDRAARLLLDREPAELGTVLDRALQICGRTQDWHLRKPAVRLAGVSRVLWAPGETPEGEPYVGRPPFTGVRQILDAVLMIAEDGHAPGTRVRMLAEPYQGRRATIVGAVWAMPAPPVAYHVHIDGDTGSLTARTEDLVVLAGQGSTSG